MTELTIKLPDDLAEQLKAAGLLHPATLEKILREALRKHEGNGLYALLDEIATIRLPSNGERPARRRK
jgi:hypothetical protein